MSVPLKITGSLIPGIKPVIKYFNAGGTFAAGDLVNLSSGELVIANVTEKILGVALEDATSSSTNVAVDCTPFLTVIMDNDNDGTTFGATHVGTNFDHIGGTGAQVIDTSSTSTTGQLTCLAYNPQGFGYDSDTSVGLFVIAERWIA